ncbi:MAG: FmdB family transcriptional regulator [Candidatus Cloacimonadota bacterium]|nr:MAG: FmdB family transcriptional regulator [Candidatus Cloacimonadota bacterium]
MPIYEYKHTDGFSNDCQEVEEFFHGISAEAYTKCPKCDHAIQRIVSMPAKHAESMKDKMSDKNLSRLGFSKYVKSSDGKYEKASGPADAPSTLDRDAMKQNLDKMGV